ncbi:MAG: bifunctional oligoribonuclease/PAP phosphatase NrnA [Alloprevotella sp.]|mgnify:CR=1 FL=1|nr:DHH family phosphoesterase [Bacteroidales bacterium]
MKNLLNEQELQALRTHIAQSSRILICAHRGPDGDAVGSSLGWAEYLRQQGKQVDIVMPTPFPDFLRWMPGSQDIRFYARHEAEAEQVIAQADLIFCLDFNGLQRLQEMQAPVAAAQAKRIIIDHHLDPDRSIAAQVVSFPTRCSTSEIVCRLIIELGGWDALPQKAAVCLYTGMMTDTGGFTYNSNDPEIYEVISMLLTKGIDKDKIYRNVFNVYSEDRMRLTGYILYRKLRFYYNRHASIFALTREEMRRFHFIRGDAEGLVNMPLQVKGMRLSISLREDTERDVVRVSLRSVDDFPCNRMAEEFFHGGGHLNASGGELPFPLSEAMLTAERAIKAYADLL